MNAASLPRYLLGRLVAANLVLLYALIIGLALLACAAIWMAGVHASQPDPQLLAPFRWLRADSAA